MAINLGGDSMAIILKEASAKGVASEQSIPGLFLKDFVNKLAVAGQAAQTQNAGASLG